MRRLLHKSYSQNDKDMIGLCIKWACFIIGVMLIGYSLFTICDTVLDSILHILACVMGLWLSVYGVMSIVIDWNLKH